MDLSAYLNPLYSFLTGRLKASSKKLKIKRESLTKDEPFV
jgi:hypothetical protein